MIKRFTPWQKNYLSVGVMISPSEMKNYYDNSVFVPIGRGILRLDCLRIYEAIIAGAIPVIVGTEEELGNSFTYGGDRLPAIYSPSWEAAVAKVELLTNDQIDARRADLTSWWSHQLVKIRNLVQRTLFPSDLTQTVQATATPLPVDAPMPSLADLKPLIVRGTRPNMWEWDYVHDLFGPPFFQHNESYDGPADAVVCAGLEDTNVISRLHSKIKVLIHLSDEHLRTNECMQLYGRSDKVIKQYWTAGRYGSNVYQMPLGYMNRYLLRERNSSLLAVNLSSFESPRPMRWSFIGGMHGRGKAERERMVSLFSNWKPYYVGKDMAPYDMKSYYDQSEFVLSGRGWENLDCLRVYEAILAGAVPIIVASNNDLDSTFHYAGHRPPALYFNNWDTAFREVQTLKTDQISAKRKELLQWWIDIIRNIRDVMRIGVNDARADAWFKYHYPI
jgi:hypothetical protein